MRGIDVKTGLWGCGYSTCSGWSLGGPDKGGPTGSQSSEIDVDINDNTFTKPPKIFLTVSKIDMRNSEHMQWRVQVNEASKNHFKIQVTTEGEPIYRIGGHWLAYQQQ